MSDLDNNAIDEPITTTGTDDYWAYLERLAEANRLRAAQAEKIDAMRERLRRR
ncbi:hypothetical protein ACYAFX_03450 [Rhodococcus aetherivorans]